MAKTSSQFALNPYFESPAPEDDPGCLREAWEFHRSLPGYAPTPLISLTTLASDLGLGGLFVKDESSRFGQHSFKALGPVYAIHRLLGSRRHGNGRPDGTGYGSKHPVIFAAATEGNHGKAVAWAARQVQHPAVIYVPRGIPRERVETILSLGARIVEVSGSYDEAVKRVVGDSQVRGWQVISDTGYPGYTEIPKWIMSAYTTLFREAQEQMKEYGAGGPDLIVVQAGVGGLAWAAVRAFLGWTPFPQVAVVEPLSADGLLQSIRNPLGTITHSQGSLDSVMHGLNCAVPSEAAWPLLRSHVKLFLAISDFYAHTALRRLRKPIPPDLALHSDFAGASGLAGLLALVQDPALSQARGHLGLGPETSVLVVNSEGSAASKL